MRSHLKRQSSSWPVIYRDEWEDPAYRVLHARYARVLAHPDALTSGTWAELVLDDLAAQMDAIQARYLDHMGSGGKPGIPGSGAG